MNEYYETEIISSADEISLAAEHVKNGNLVAFPTETVYGLGANAMSKEAVEKIFLVKKRPQDNPLIVHLAYKEDIRKYVREIPKEAQVLIDHFMPGPLTIILKRLDNLAENVSLGLDTVAIRVPEHPVAREFLRECGCPVAAPSANISTRISPTTAKHVYDDFHGNIKYIIDGGKAQIGIESTVVDVSDGKAIILRPGVIVESEIKKVLASIEQTDKLYMEHSASPGMKYKHYAPKTEMHLISSDDGLKSAIDFFTKENKSLVFIGSKKFLEKIPSIYMKINVGDRGRDFASNIYDALHTAQDMADVILCEYFKQDEISKSVMNRLLKSSNNSIY